MLSHQSISVAYDDEELDQQSFPPPAYGDIYPNGPPKRFERFIALSIPCYQENSKNFSIKQATTITDHDSLSCEITKNLLTNNRYQLETINMKSIEGQHQVQQVKPKNRYQSSQSVSTAKRQRKRWQSSSRSSRNAKR